MPALNKYSLIGVGVQSAEGTQATSFTWLPLAGDLGFQEEMNPETLDMADRNHFDHLVYSKGQWWTGNIPVYLCQGAVSTIIDLIQTRDGNNQGKWASVWITQAVTGDGSVAGTSLWRAAIDTKVNSAEFAFAVGSPVRVDLNCTGKASGSVSEAPTGYATALQVQPFLWKECTLSFGTYGGAYATDYTINDLSVTIDNSVESPEDGMRFNGSANPYRLYNTGGCAVTGTFTRDFSDKVLYTAWQNQYGAAWYAPTYNIELKMVIAVSGSTYLTITMPNVRITGWSAPPAGSRRGLVKESVSFTALGSYNGATEVAPITLA